MSAVKECLIITEITISPQDLSRQLYVSEWAQTWHASCSQMPQSWPRR